MLKFKLCTYVLQFDIELCICIRMDQALSNLQLYHSLIRLCGKRTLNIHIYITQNIGIPKHEKHLRLLSSGTKLFITFEFKGSSTLGERSYLPNPSARVGYDTRSIFKRSLTGLNSEFSFSQTSCLTKAEEPSLPYYFTHSWRENNWIHSFPKGISAM